MAAETQLPFLNWAAGECAGIIDDIEEQWQALAVELKTRLTVQVRDLVKDGAWWRLRTLSKATGPMRTGINF
jgi:hypothetical protein